MLQNQKKGKKGGKSRNQRQVAGVRHGPAAQYTYYVPRNSRNFLPRREFVQLEQTMVGYYGNGTAQSSGITAIYANSFGQPFSTGANAIGTTGSGKSNITVQAGYNLTDHPFGYTELSSIYAYYKIHKSKMKITIVGTNGNDVFTMMLFPSILAQSSFIGQASSEPYAKFKQVCSTGQPVSFQRTIDVCELLGYTRDQYQGLTPTLLGSQPAAATSCFWNFQWQNIASQNPSGNFSIVFELSTYIELSEIGQFTS